ncbi:hypothetical protein C2S53_008993 [Perilla frutescens var. hirtella]|uniref:GRF-type domain-containing protein n=1 Tax=Perilla frutescens var. hirtella TaxID=608512 RepID=A0AAD4IWN4_PERFH|nr:hypothetical protein C2S53_008993 [Perilla frutescens var. hirtella]
MNGQVNPNMLCRCEVRAALRTSWTPDNPGRRFLCCPRSGIDSCGFWTWYDPVMCARARAIIPGLLRRINGAEAEVVALKKNKKKLWLFNILLCIILLWKLMY